MTRTNYEEYLVRRHRPAHGRRNADRWAAFLGPHLRTDMRVLDIGCGPGSITVGLPGRVIGVDVHPVPIPSSPVAAGDGAALPFSESAFDAVYINAVLQHVVDASAVLCEARRVMRSGAVIGVGDTDWGTRIMHPHDPLLDRGQEIQERARESGNVRVGRELRGLLAGAGFERIEIGTEGRVVGSEPAVAQMAAFERGWFEAPEVVAYVTEFGLSDAAEMAEIAAAWTRWSTCPAACAVDQWFTGIAWSPML